MFDMQKIGKKIVSLRKQKNMTRMEPAEIFEVSLDELLGEKSSLVEAAVENKLEECVKAPRF